MTAYSSVPCLSSTARIVVSERFVCLFRVLTAATVLKYISDMYARDVLIPERKMRRQCVCSGEDRQVLQGHVIEGKGTGICFGLCGIDSLFDERFLAFACLGCALGM